ncbi:MAG: glycosyltransferase [Planctomycetes bacterium]|nr:glycosyltransferase [Planctomycetota bacterium]
MPTVAMVYSKDASRQTAGMDLIRWIEMGHQLASCGWTVHLVTDKPAGIRKLRELPVVDAAAASWERYDAVKVCYQHSIDLVPPHPCIIVRMCRVADEHRPKRDHIRRKAVLAQQERVSEIARFVSFNDQENARRWRAMYGNRQETLLVPTGCPESIPTARNDPFRTGRRVVLFAGSLTAPRFVGALNALAERLRSVVPDVDVHFVGRNRLHVYGVSGAELDPGLIKIHAPVRVEESWQYLLHADVGVALAPSEDAFESELSKIYYYLRAGLPVVTESNVPNRTLLEETGHGFVAEYDDVGDLVTRIAEALELETRHPEVMGYMAAKHSWRGRAEVYVNALAALSLGDKPVHAR